MGVTAIDFYHEGQKNKPFNKFLYQFRMHSINLTMA